MSERRLPPALEEKVQGDALPDAGYVEVSDILDWLYGTEEVEQMEWRPGVSRRFKSTPDIVGRVERRLHDYRAVEEWRRALRAELGMEEAP